MSDAGETTPDSLDLGPRITASVEAVTEPALAYLGLDELLRELLERTTKILNADTAAVLLVENEGETLAARAAKGLEEEVERGFRLPIGAGFAGRVAAERRPIVIEDVSSADVVNPLLREKGVRSLLGVPLVVEGTLVGVLHVGTLTRRMFTGDDARLLQLVADRVALAIERERLFEQSKAVDLLQRSLLPGRLPEVPGFAFAARYLSGTAGSPVGGDWYDVIPLPGGGIGASIGDVMGRGTRAAALMGQIRNALRAYALQGDSPAVVAQKLANFAATLEAGQMVTVIYAVLDSDAGLLRYVSAGHPPPLIVRPDGSAGYIEHSPAVPLGVGGSSRYSETEAEVPPGSTVLFYTDGLVERRGERLLDRQAQLAREAQRAPFDPELLCGHVASAMLDDRPAFDDVALLAIQMLPSLTDELSISVLARPEELGSVRRMLRRWLNEAGADERAISGLTLACAEACTNAIEHAYGPADATFELAGTRQGPEVTITIRDSGQWRPPRGRNRGRGIALMKAFTNDVEVTPTPAGTTVRLTHRLGDRS